MIKKITASVISSFLVFSAFLNVYALDIKYERDARSITVSGTAAKNEVISIFVMDLKDKELSSITANDIKDNTVRFAEVKADENGLFSDTFYSEKKGNFKIFLRGKSADVNSGFKEESSVDIYTPTELLDTRTDLNSKTTDKSVLVPFLEDENNRKILGIDKLYNALKEKELLGLLYSSLSNKTFPDYATLNATVLPIELQLKLIDDLNAMVNKVQVANLINTLFTVYKVPDSYYSTYKSMQDKSYVDGLIFTSKPYKDLDSVYDVFKSAVSTTPSKDATTYSNNMGGSSSIGAVIGNPSTNITTNHSQGFDDVPNGHWAKESIEFLAQLGIISGFEQNTFIPDKPVTREQFVKMLVCTISPNFVINTNSKFTDLEENAWYTPYITAAQNSGLVSGNPNGTFGIGQALTRQDMAVLILRATEQVGITLEKNATLKFNDNSLIDNYAKESVAILSNAGIVNGMGNGYFAPKEVATRAQAAQLICLMIKLMESGI